MRCAYSVVCAVLCALRCLLCKCIVLHTNMYCKHFLLKICTKYIGIFCVYCIMRITVLVLRCRTLHFLRVQRFACAVRVFSVYWYKYTAMYMQAHTAQISRVVACFAVLCAVLRCACVRCAVYRTAMPYYYI